MNYVNLPTRYNNILDLILTNDYDLIQGTNIEVNSGFSDHNTVTCYLDMMCNEVDRCESIMKYMTAVPNYGWRSGLIDQ